MQSLTVFDPKKVFTEVIKLKHAVLQHVRAFYNPSGIGSATADDGVLQTP